MIFFFSHHRYLKSTLYSTLYAPVWLAVCSDSAICTILNISRGRLWLSRWTALAPHATRVRCSKPASRNLLKMHTPYMTHPLSSTVHPPFIIHRTCYGPTRATFAVPERKLHRFHRRERSHIENFLFVISEKTVDGVEPVNSARWGTRTWKPSMRFKGTCNYTNN